MRQRNCLFMVALVAICLLTLSTATPAEAQTCYGFSQQAQFGQYTPSAGVYVVPGLSLQVPDCHQASAQRTIAIYGQSAPTVYSPLRSFSHSGSFAQASIYRSFGVKNQFQSGYVSVAPIQNVKQFKQAKVFASVPVGHTPVANVLVPASTVKVGNAQVAVPPGSDITIRKGLFGRTKVKIDN